MRHILRHDGALLSPCPHCARKPQHVTRETHGSTHHHLECPNPHCGLSTGDHESFEDAKAEWEETGAEWDNH